MKVNTNAPPNTGITLDKTKHLERAAVDEKSRQAGASPAQLAEGAKVDISDKARLMHKAAEVVRSAKDASPEKIAALKKSIADGSYKVDADALADKILEDHLNTNFGKNNV